MPDTKRRIRWMPESYGEIAKSRCGRFVIIEGAGHYTLLYKGSAIERNIRMDLLKDSAEELIKDQE